MESKQSKQDRLSVKKHPIFPPSANLYHLFLFVVFLCMFGFLFFFEGEEGFNTHLLLLLVP